MLFVAALVDAVPRHVEDRWVIAAVSEEIGRIYGGG